MVVLDPSPDNIRIRFFGSVDVAGPRGTEARLAEQPKNLAIVAYLALARPASFQRDRLLGLFWPEKTEDRARASRNPVTTADAVSAKRIRLYPELIRQK